VADQQVFPAVSVASKNDNAKFRKPISNDEVGLNV